MGARALQRADGVQLNTALKLMSRRPCAAVRGAVSVLHDDTILPPPAPLVCGAGLEGEGTVVVQWSARLHLLSRQH